MFNLKVTFSIVVVAENLLSQQQPTDCDGDCFFGPGLGTGCRLGVADSVSRYPEIS